MGQGLSRPPLLHGGDCDTGAQIDLPVEPVIKYYAPKGILSY
jgi:hypothetical protein